MNKDDSLALMILLGIIAISLFGGTKAVHFDPLMSTSSTPPSNEAQIQQQINQTKNQVENLKVKIQAEEDKKTHSQYFDHVHINFVNRSSDPAYEYMMIQVSRDVAGPVRVTGWTLKSLASGESITIPKASYLFFTHSPNSEEDVYVNPGDTLYLVTGSSPNGVSFKLNKCSGYLNQFQTFIPYLSTYCPAPRDENLSSIPKTPNNDACLDYINTFPSCRIQTESTPANWSPECTNFIYSKINYPSCVDTHKNDPDFYLSEWRIYLKRSVRLWKDRRENIVLYDKEGKIVDTLTY